MFLEWNIFIKGQVSDLSDWQTKQNKTKCYGPPIKSLLTINSSWNSVWQSPYPLISYCSNLKEILGAIWKIGKSHLCHCLYGTIPCVIAILRDELVFVGGNSGAIWMKGTVQGIPGKNDERLICCKTYTCWRWNTFEKKTFDELLLCVLWRE